jgi:hypothetical protein
VSSGGELSVLELSGCTARIAPNDWEDDPPLPNYRDFGSRGHGSRL